MIRSSTAPAGPILGWRSPSDPSPLIQYFPSRVSAAPLGLCLIVQSPEAPDPRDYGNAEVALWTSLAGALQDRGIATMIMQMPDPSDPCYAVRAEEIVERQKRILGLFSFAHSQLPDVPSVIAANAEGALCALALLQGRRDSTKNVRGLVVTNCHDERAESAPVRSLSLGRPGHPALEGFRVNCPKKRQALRERLQDAIVEQLLG